MKTQIKMERDQTSRMAPKRGYFHFWAHASALQYYQVGSLVNSKMTNLLFLCANSDFKKTSSGTYGNLREQETKEHDILGSINKIKSSLKVNQEKITVDSNM